MWEWGKDCFFGVWGAEGCLGFFLGVCVFFLCVFWFGLGIFYFYCGFAVAIVWLRVFLVVSCQWFSWSLMEKGKMLLLHSSIMRRLLLFMWFYLRILTLLFIQLNPGNINKLNKVYQSNYIVLLQKTKKNESLYSIKYSELMLN